MANSDKYRLIELQRENDQLCRTVDELTLLNELATASAGMSGLTEILQTIIINNVHDDDRF